MQIRIFFLISVVIILASCSSYEKIGDFKYKTKIVRVNTGDADEMIKLIKVYENPNNNIEQLNFVMSGKRWGFERKKDTLLVKGEMFFYKQNNINIIKTKETTLVSVYKSVPDSIVRFYEQDNFGNIKMQSIIKYKNNLIEEKIILE